MTRLPWPSCTALLVEFVYHCRSWLLTLSPVSMVHLEPSTGVPAAALNSSGSVVAAMLTSPEGADTAALFFAGQAPVGSEASTAAMTMRSRDRREGCVDINVTADVGFCWNCQQRCHGPDHP